MTQPLEALLKEIRMRAEKATQGKWIARSEPPGTFLTPSIEKATGGILAQMTHYHPMNDDAEHIARLDPPTVKILCEIIERQQKALELSLPGSSCFPDIQDKYSRYLMQRQAQALSDINALAAKALKGDG